MMTDNKTMKTKFNRFSWGTYLCGVLVVSICHRINPGHQTPTWMLVVVGVLMVYLWAREAVNDD